MAGRPWTEAEDRLLRDHEGKTHWTLLAKRINRTPAAVRVRREKLGLTFDRAAEFGPECQDEKPHYFENNSERHKAMRNKDLNTI